MKSDQLNKIINYTLVKKEKYFKNKNYFLHLINEMYKNDDNKLANLEEIKNHLDFIFSASYKNNAFLILQIEDNILISMINFFEYNTFQNEWCLFSLFVRKKYRRMGYGENILKYGLLQLKKYNCKKLISGIESDNIASINLHKRVGFKYANCDWDEIAEGFPKNHLGFILQLDKTN